MKPIESLSDEMARTYEKPDPWNYGQANRHMITAGVCQSMWKGGTIIEHGCGEGILLHKLCKWLYPVPGYVFGLDLDPVACLRAAQLLNEVKPQSSDIQPHDARKPFPQMWGDLVLVSDVLPYMPGEAAGIIREAWAQVVMGGVLVLTSWVNGHDAGPCFDGIRDLDHSRVVSRLRWEGLAIGGQGEDVDAKADYLVIQRV